MSITYTARENIVSYHHDTFFQTHLPGYVEQADTLASKGVQVIACVAVNDPFVMAAWGQAQNAGKVTFLLNETACSKYIMCLQFTLAHPSSIRASSITLM